jgi:hypothetical protein
MRNNRVKLIVGICIAAVLLICILIIVVPLFRFEKTEQTPSAPPKPLIAREDLSIESLTRVLGLSGVQVKRMKSVLKAESKRREAILRIYALQDGSLSETGLQQLAEFSKYYEKMYSHILDEEQYTGFMRIRGELGRTVSK